MQTKYSLNDLDRASVEKVIAGLAELPFKDVFQLLPHLQGQIRIQDQAAQEAYLKSQGVEPVAAQPIPEDEPAPVPHDLARLHDVAGDADELIK